MSSVNRKRERPQHIPQGGTTSSVSSGLFFSVIHESSCEVDFLTVLRTSSSSSESTEALSRLAQALYFHQPDIYEHTNILKHRWLLHTLLSFIESTVPPFETTKKPTTTKVTAFSTVGANKVFIPTVDQMILANLALTCLSNMVHSSNSEEGNNGNRNATDGNHQRIRMYSIETAITLALDLRALSLFLRILNYYLSFSPSGSSTTIASSFVSADSASTSDNNTVHSILSSSLPLPIYSTYSSMVRMILSMLTVIANFTDLSGTLYGKSVQYSLSRLPIPSGKSFSLSSLSSTGSSTVPISSSLLSSFIASFSSVGLINQQYFSHNLASSFLSSLERYIFSSASTHEGFLYVLDILTNLLTDPNNVPYVETWIRQSPILPLILQCVQTFPETFLMDIIPTVVDSSSRLSVKAEGITIFNPLVDLEMSSEKYYGYLSLYTTTEKEVGEKQGGENEHIKKMKKDDDYRRTPSESIILSSINTTPSTEPNPSADMNPSRTTNPLSNSSSSVKMNSTPSVTENIHWTSLVSVEQISTRPLRYRYMAIQRRDASIIFLSALSAAINLNVSRSPSSLSITNDSTTTTNTTNWLQRLVLEPSNDLFPRLITLFGTSYGIRDIRIYLLIILKELIKNNSELCSSFTLYTDTRITSTTTIDNLPLYSDTLFHGTPIDLVPIMILQTVQSYRLSVPLSLSATNSNNNNNNPEDIVVETPNPISNNETEPTTTITATIEKNNEPSGDDNNNNNSTKDNIPNALDKFQTRLVNDLFSLLSPYTSPESIRMYSLFLKRKKKGTGNSE